MSTLMPMYPGKANSPSTKLLNDISATDTRIIVTDATALLPSASLPYLTCIGPSTGFNTFTETVRVTEIIGNTLTIVRAVEGPYIAPAGRVWPNGSLVAINFCNAHYANIISNIETFLLK